MISVLFLVVVIMVMVGVAMMLGAPPRTWQHALSTERPSHSARAGAVSELRPPAQD